jgi:uncharacterized protein (DUF697 family)
LTSIWQNIKESDLRPLREQAIGGIQIAIIGDPGTGRTTLAEQMRRDPNRPQLSSDTPLLILDLGSADHVDHADLIILMVDSHKAEISYEQELLQRWQNHGKRVLVFINQSDNPQEALVVSPWTSRTGRRVVMGSPGDTHFLIEKFAPTVVEVLPEHLLGLGRYFPLFRLPIAHHLVNETSLSNAAYAMSTGLAEIIPILDIPVTIADTIVLTKAQAFLVYKLGLALGYSTRWQDYIGEFGGVLGSGFVWRQIARSLVGLIPVWGIVPKTAIAYSGTYVVGNVVLQWYLTGKHLSKKQIQQLYNQALGRGKSMARNLVARLPQPRLPRFRLPHPKRPGTSRSKQMINPPRSTQEKPETAYQSSKKRSRKGKNKTCPNCGNFSASDASFCQYCGTSLD